MADAYIFAEQSVFIYLQIAVSRLKECIDERNFLSEKGKKFPMNVQQRKITPVAQ